MGLFCYLCCPECHQKRGGEPVYLSYCNIFGLTGTPMTSDRTELDKMIGAFGHGNHGLKITTKMPCYSPLNKTWAAYDQGLVEKLRKLMIRHTKAMRIHGKTALALPELEAETVWLDMTLVERRAYEIAKCQDNTSGLGCKTVFESGRLVFHAVQSFHLAMSEFGNAARALSFPRFC